MAVKIFGKLFLEPHFRGNGIELHHSRHRAERQRQAVPLHRREWCRDPGHLDRRHPGGQQNHPGDRFRAAAGQGLWRCRFRCRRHGFLGAAADHLQLEHRRCQHRQRQAPYPRRWHEHDHRHPGWQRQLSGGDRPAGADCGQGQPDHHVPRTVRQGFWRGGFHPRRHRLLRLGRHLCQLESGRRHHRQRQDPFDWRRDNHDHRHPGRRRQVERGTVAVATSRGRCQPSGHSLGRQVHCLRHGALGDAAERHRQCRRHVHLHAGGIAGRRPETGGRHISADGLLPARQPGSLWSRAV